MASQSTRLNKDSKALFGNRESDRFDQRLSLGDWLVTFAILAFFFEGAIRKWLLPQDSPFSYVCLASKEAFVLAGLVFMPAGERFSSSIRDFKGYLFGIPMIAVILGCITAAFQSLSPVGSLMTLRSMVILPVGACFAYKLLSPQLIKASGYAVAVCILINAPLSIIQFYSPASDVINKYVGDGFSATTGFSERVRATGTFSYIAGLAIASIAGAVAGLGMFLSEKNHWLKFLGICVYGGSVVMALATVSRGPVFAIGFITVALVFRSSQLMGVSAIIAMLLGGLWLTVDDEGKTYEFTTAIVERTLSADGIADRITQPLIDAYDTAIQYPLGNGLGVGQSSERRFGSQQVVETEWGRIFYELGWLGGIGYALTYGGAIAFLARLYRKAKGIEVRLALMASTLFCGILMYSGVAFNHFSSSVFWVVFLLACYAFDRSTKVPVRFRQQTQAIPNG